MARRKIQPNRVDELLDDLLADCHSPDDIIGESGLLKQISQRLIERALVGELNHHLKTEPQPQEQAADGEAPEA
jgi:putative transposase